MVGIGSGYIIILMTGEAIGWGVVEIPIGMAKRTIVYIVTQGKWEKLMVEGRWHPSWVGGMTLGTIGWEIGIHVIGIHGLRIIFGMAGHTFG